jgi:hypothetical protein
LGSSKYQESEGKIDIYADTPVEPEYKTLKEKNKQAELQTRQEQKEMREEARQLQLDND